MIVAKGFTTTGGWAFYGALHRSRRVELLLRWLADRRFVRRPREKRRRAHIQHVTYLRHNTRFDSRFSALEFEDPCVRDANRCSKRVKR
jgi:hypothetical protein